MIKARNKILMSNSHLDLDKILTRFSGDYLEILKKCQDNLIEISAGSFKRENSNKSESPNNTNSSDSPH